MRDKVIFNTTAFLMSLLAATSAVQAGRDDIAEEVCGEMNAVSIRPSQDPEASQSGVATLQINIEEVDQLSNEEKKNLLRKWSGEHKKQQEFKAIAAEKARLVEEAERELEKDSVLSKVVKGFATSLQGRIDHETGRTIHER